jgi:hypothetical protein
MLRYKFEVVLETDGGDDDTYEVLVDARDIREWEARHDKSFLTNALSLTDTTELAYFATARTKVRQIDMAGFLARAVSVSDASKDGGEEPARPTRKGRGGTPASR